VPEQPALAGDAPPIAGSTALHLPARGHSGQDYSDRWARPGALAIRAERAKTPRLPEHPE